MKKIAFAALLLAAPLALSACGGTTSALAIEANWYANTKLGDNNIGGTYEKLVYTVGTEGGRPVTRDGYSVFYGKTSDEETEREGTYTTVLTAEQYEPEDGSAPWKYYKLTADLSVTVRFGYGNAAAEFVETSHSEVTFLPAGGGLAPLRSFREVHCHTPTEYPTEQLLCNEYHYSYEATYKGDLSSATIVYKDLLNKTEQTDSYELEGDGSYLDNEEIMFALRGVYSFLPFRTFNTSMGKVMTVETRNAKENGSKNFSYVRNGETFSGEVGTYLYSIGYGSGVGVAASLLYAAKTSDSDNFHRNALLEMDLPVLRSFGNIHYRLKEATFSDK